MESKKNFDKRMHFLNRVIRESIIVKGFEPLKQANEWYKAFDGQRMTADDSINNFKAFLNERESVNENV